MLKQRILTSLILIPLVLLGIFYTSATIFQIILASILLLGAWEWTNFANLKETYWRIAYLLLLILFFFLAQNLSFTIFIALGAFWWIFISSFLITPSHKNKVTAVSNRLILISGLLIFTSCFSALSFLRDQSENWVIFLLVIIWLADIAAYFIGKQFGKHALAPQISPKKTWEGFFGAIVVVAVVTFISGFIILQIDTTRLMSLWVLAILVTIISVVGDLFESYLKRQIGIKDSGQLLPGHGGLLDRIDSLIAAAPVFAMGVYLLTLLG